MANALGGFDRASRLILGVRWHRCQQAPQKKLPALCNTQAEESPTGINSLQLAEAFFSVSHFAFSAAAVEKCVTTACLNTFQGS
jgi:hypothetical protein